MKRLPDLALGSYEAGAVMGVHFTRPARMFTAGQLVGRALDPVWVADSSRSFAIYSLKSCEEDWEEYQYRLTLKGRDGVMRPRAWTDDREPALKRLRAMKHQILYDDAIGTAEAAKIMGVHFTAVQKLVAAGKIVARVPWNPRRSGGSRGFIISRKSCEENRRIYAAAKKDGTFRGRTRGAKNKVDR